MQPFITSAEVQIEEVSKVVAVFWVFGTLGYPKVVKILDGQTDVTHLLKRDATIITALRKAAESKKVGVA